MQRLIAYFRKSHDILISDRTAARLAHTVQSMRGIDPALPLGVTGADVAALLPRRIDVRLGELRAVLAGRRVA